MLKSAAALAWLCGLGFGVPGAYGTWYYAEHDRVWTFMGFPTNESGPLFESVGLDTSVPLLIAFTVVCAVEIVLGVLLWQRRRSGVGLSLALLPLEFAFWIGLVLPVGPVAGVARTVLVLMAWPVRSPSQLADLPDVHPTDREQARGDDTATDDTATRSRTWDAKDKRRRPPAGKG